MNRSKLAARTELAARIRDRHQPPYRVYDANRQQHFAAKTRDEARDIKRQIASEGGTAWIEQRLQSSPNRNWRPLHAELRVGVRYERVR